METPKTISPVILDGESLTLDQVMVVAYGQPGQPKVELSPQAKVRVMRRMPRGPIIINVKGSDIALGPDICADIFVEKK